MSEDIRPDENVDNMPSAEEADTHADAPAENTVADKIKAIIDLISDGEAEDLSSAIRIAATKIPRAERFNILNNLGEEALLKIIEKRILDVGPSTYQTEAGELGTFANVQALQHANRSTEADRVHAALNAITDKSQLLAKLTGMKGDKEVRILGPASPKPNFGGADNPLSGTDALIAFKQGRNRNSVGRFPLYNSGFHVDMVSPARSEINSFITQTRVDVATYGRLMGSHFYLFADALIKEVCIRFIMSCIKNSTLRGWDKRNVFLENVSLHDFDVLLWAMACLMYPNGYNDFRSACTGDKCSHVETGTIDLFKLALTDFSRLNKNAIMHLVSNTAKDSVGASEIMTYHKELGLSKEVRVKNIGISLAVPSLARYFSASQRFMSLMIDQIYSEAPEATTMFAAYRLYRQTAPYIKELRLYEDETSDNVLTATSDIEAIEAILDDIQTDDEDNSGKLFAAITDFINTTKLTHLAIPAYECPACGTMQQTQSGYLTLDPLRVFFMMCIQKSEGQK